MADKYKKLKRQVSTDGGYTWTDLIPYEYIAGELIQKDSPDCNNIEWRTVSGYICEGNTTEMTQWVADTGYACVGTDKYNKEKEQISYNSGISWADTGNTRAGSTLIEQNSEDCGYVPPTPYPTEYLTTEALNSGSIGLNKHTDSGYKNKEPITNIQYSKNDGDWTSYTYGTNISVVTGDKIRWKGSKRDGNEYKYYSYFASTADYKAYGNPLSLLRNDSFVDEPDAIYQYAYYRLFYNSSTLKDISGLALPATTLAAECYYFMFYGCTSLTTAPALPATTLALACYYGMFYGCTSLTTAPVLPATTLAEKCYEDMFSLCTSLTTAPELPATTLAFHCCDGMFYRCTSLTTAPTILPATTLASDCYYRMFYGCTNLTTAPVLPATTLADNCYQQMFWGCTSLTTAPVLPAATLAEFCYTEMFWGCTSLNYIKCCATDISATYCTYNWVDGVASTGTFHKDANTTWPTGISGIPSGWTTRDTCGCEPTIRWVADTGYMCVGFDKYNKEKEQQSTDGGEHWTDTGNTRAGSTLIETESVDCGYIGDGKLYLSSDCDENKPYCTINGNILTIHIPQNTLSTNYVIQSTLKILGMLDTSSYYTYYDNGDNSSDFDINLNLFDFTQIPDRIYQMSISFKARNDTLKYWVDIQQFTKENSTYIYAYPDTATCPRSSILYFNKTNNTNDYSHYSDIEGFAASHNVTTYDNTSLGNICVWRNEYNGTDTTATINGKTYIILKSNNNYILPSGENHYIVWNSIHDASLVDIVSDSQVYVFGNGPEMFRYSKKALKMNLMTIGLSKFGPHLPYSNFDNNSYDRILNMYGFNDGMVPELGDNTTINYICVENCALC